MVTDMLACAMCLAVAMGCRPDACDRPLLGVQDACMNPENFGKNRRIATNPNLIKAAKELGADFFVYHVYPVTDQGEGNSAAMSSDLALIDETMRRNGFKYTLNNEYPNFVKSAEITPGVDEFAHPDGTHRWDLRMDWLAPVLAGKNALIGVTYDECEHMQLTCNQFATYPDQKPFDAPFLVDTTGKDLETAYNRLVAKCKWLRTRHYQNRVRPATEQVWPDMFHIFARAGWTIAPKILKENLSSVVMAISLGAALEYQDTGLEWWVTPDLWGKGNYPGHSPQALRSALVMGYWLGADALYVENLDFGPYGKPHPLAPPNGSLITWQDDKSYKITPYGDAVREFYTRYVPDHPLKHSWRNYRPKVAIIRLPDGDWGQRGTFFRDRLLGNSEHPSDEISREWLQVWPILTHGVARPGAISINNETVYPEYPWPFFVPIDSVAVFDHLVTGPVLDSVECFIVCGHALSNRTFEEIAKRVEDGATCIIARRLYSRCIGSTLPMPPPEAASPSDSASAACNRSNKGEGVGAGRWVIVDSFSDPAVAKSLRPFLGPPDVARFRFKDLTIEFRVEDGDRDSIGVKAAPTCRQALPTSE